MSFQHIKSISFFSLNTESIFLKSIFNDEIGLIDNVNYKINFIKNKNSSIVHSFKLNPNNNTVTTSNEKFPENGLLFELPTGNYKLLYNNGFIKNETTNEFNKSIKSSKGNIILNDISFNDDIIIFQKYNQFNFSIKNGEKFSIWIENLNSSILSGEIELSIVKISNSKKSDSEAIIFTKGMFDNLLHKFEKETNYLIEIYELNDEVYTKPDPKYPNGTYQITLNSRISSSSNDDDLKQDMIKDLGNFQLYGRKNCWI